MGSWIYYRLNRLSTGAFVLACLVTLFPARADDWAFGLPNADAGWTKTDIDGGLALRKEFPTADDAGSALIHIMKPIPLASQDFVAGFAALAASIPELAREPALWRKTGVTAIGDTITVEERCCAIKGDVTISQTIAGIKGEDKLAFAVLVQTNLDKNASRETETTFQSIVRSWRLDPDGDGPALSPAEDGGGLEGAYMTFRSRFRPNGLGGMNVSLENKVIVFEPSGFYVGYIPPRDKEIAVHCREISSECGTYRLTGGGILSSPDRIEFNAPATEYLIFSRKEYPFAKEIDALEIGEARYRPLEPLVKGMRLSGLWRSANIASSETTSSAVVAASATTFIFKDDGSFIREGWSGASFSHEAANTRTGFTSAGRKPSRQGRYEIQGYYLILAGDDGQSETLTLFKPEKDSDKVLTINGQNYLKQ